MACSYKEKMRIFKDFCLKNLDKIGIGEKAFYYIWRYIVIELDKLIQICKIEDDIADNCGRENLAKLHNAGNKLLYAQYSSVSNKEVIEILQTICRCVEESWHRIEGKLEMC
ncbi:MAG: hypothetical protein QW348_05110 [Ignisphaera sp.]